jgi:teichuronic acid biosynthesis glycosyltransferase TuaG
MSKKNLADNNFHKKKIIFSIIIPCFNAAKTIERPFLSLLKQTYKNFEVIIVNDGSTDNSTEIIENYLTKDPRFILINHFKNSGVANTRNTGLDNVRGKYVCFLDADDWWPKNKLEVYLEYFKKGYDLLFSDYTRINISNGKTKIVKVINDLKYKNLIYSNHIPASSAVFNSESLGIPKFKKYHTSSDWIFWLEIFKKKPKVLGINKNLMFYCVSNQTLSSNKINMSFQAWKIFRSYHGYSVCKSTYLMLLFIFHGIKKRL